MPRISQEDLRSIGDLATTYRWSMAIAKAPAGLAAQSNALNLRCESSELPKMTMTPLEQKIRGHKINFSGQAEYAGTLTFTFTETVDNKIVDFIKSWKELHWETQTGVAQAKKDQEMEFIITRLDSSDVEIYKYNLIGCIYNDSDFGSLDSENAAMKPTLTISYDYFTEGSV